MARLQCPPFASQTSFDSLNEGYESDPSKELEEVVEEFMPWLERTRPPPKIGAEEEIPIDVLEEFMSVSRRISS